MNSVSKNVEDVLIAMKKRFNLPDMEPETMTRDEYDQKQVEFYNTSKGNLAEIDGYNCTLCNNKGDIQYVKNGYIYTKSCSCMGTRKAIANMNRSGLQNVIRDYTFDKFEGNVDWQKGLKEKAMTYTKDENNTWFFVGGNPGCVDSDTEYFNGHKWKRIADYTEGEKVLQYEPTGKNGEGTTTLVIPKRYIKSKADVLYNLETQRGSINQTLSLDHNFAYISSKGNFTKKPFLEVIKQIKNNSQGFQGRVLSAFNFDGKGIDLTDNEIRLMCAVIADGHFRKNLVQCHIHIKKDRKKERLEKLLNESGIKYRKTEKSNGYTLYAFRSPRIEKEFTSYWYGCSNEQLKTITDEVLHWDGYMDDKGRRRFSTTSKESADFIQFAFSATGRRATIRTLDRVNELHKSIEYEVQISDAIKLRIPKDAEIKEVNTNDGYQYCFTVDSGYLVLRKNNRIFITGNSGKTHICTAICREFLLKGEQVKYMLWKEESTILKAVINSDVYGEKIEKLKNVDILYIDDFLKPVKDKQGEIAMPTPADVSLAFEILDYRKNKQLRTIISSERHIGELIEIDEATGSRIVEMTRRKYLTNIKRDKSRNFRLQFDFDTI